MKIVYSVDEDADDMGHSSDSMTIYDKDGNRIADEYVGPLCECPEDAIIERSLISCNDIISYMKKAYEAGKNGEEFIVE